MSRPSVFISYSHKDERWKNRLVTHLGVLQQMGILNLWDDRRIAAGAGWEQEIQAAMDAASVAVVLVSANSLTSQFILRREVSYLLQRRDREGIRIIPIIAKPCDWEAVDWLRRMQCRPKDGVPLSKLRTPQADEELREIAREIRSLIGGSALHGPVHTGLHGSISETSGWSLHLLGQESSSTGGVPIPRNGSLVIGRGAVAGLPLPEDDKRVSRRHAIVRMEAGSAVVEDCESKNGTFVNGVRRNRAVLHHGDLLRVGRTEMRVVGDDLETETASAYETSTEG